MASGHSGRTFNASDPASPGPASALPRWSVVDRRFLLLLLALALLTRLIWVLWVHPPGEYVWSDMGQYVRRARRLLEHGFETEERWLAWQTYGTHFILAGAMALFGDAAPLTGAGVVWGCFSAATVVGTYLVATRVTDRPALARVVGVAALLWYPNLAGAGYFQAETPFACFNVWTTYALLRLLQEGRMPWLAGGLGAVAFAIRPQVAIYCVLALGLWAANRGRLPHAPPRKVAAVAVPLVMVLAFSMWRFHNHTGRWLGVSENASMNLTAGRCHNTVTKAYPDEEALERSKTAKVKSRRVSLPAFRGLWRRGDDHPFGLRPALGSDTISFAGYVGDPEIHREIRRRCYAKTGLVGQLRYSVINVSLLWSWSPPWPDSSDRRQHRALWFASIAYWNVYRVLLLVPVLWGLILGLRQWRGNTALALVAAQLLVSFGVASVFFGSARLRSPYDPFALILLVVAVVDVSGRIRAWRAKGKR